MLTGSGTTYWGVLQLELRTHSYAKLLSLIPRLCNGPDRVHNNAGGVAGWWWVQQKTSSESVVPLTWEEAAMAMGKDAREIAGDVGML